MAKPTFENYLISANKQYINGICNNNYHFSLNASICLRLECQGQRPDDPTYYLYTSGGTLKNSSIDNTSLYRIVVAIAVQDHDLFLDSFRCDLHIWENGYKLDYTLDRNIIEKVLRDDHHTNLVFQFTYDVNDVYCKLFNNSIIYKIIDGYEEYHTYNEYVSPIACGRELAENPNVNLSNLTTDSCINKCIIAKSATLWDSSIKDRGNGSITIGYDTWHGDMNTYTSKQYNKGDLVRYCDISIGSAKKMNDILPFHPL